MKIPIDEARQLSLKVLSAHGLPSDAGAILTDHLIDAHCTGHTYAGLPRLVVLLQRLREIPSADLGRTDVIEETASSAWIDGRGNLGYITCQRAIDIGIEKARTAPVVVVGAFNSHYSGRLGYYVEQAARQGLIALHTSSASPMVAAPGGTRAILGTNPISAAFPTSDSTVVCDLNTAGITWGSVDLAAHVGEQLPPGKAIDSSGKPTTDPNEALKGALLPWGEHKGFALSLAIAALGVLAGGAAIPSKFGNWGYLFIILRSDAFLPSGEFERRMDELVANVRTSSDSVRIPGERSRQLRQRSQEEGLIEVPDEVLKTLSTMVG